MSMNKTISKHRLSFKVAGLPLLALTLLSGTHSLTIASDKLPPEWSNVQVCRPSLDPKAPALVIGYVARMEAPGSRYVVRAHLQGPLPGYVDGTAGWPVDIEREVAPDEGVGYIEAHRKTFVLPSGTHLTCGPGVEGAVAKRADS